MTPAVSSPTTSGRRDGGARLQGVLAIASLVFAVLVTVVLVATPASSVAPGPAAEPTIDRPGTWSLPPGLRVEVQGGEALDAYALGDRLTAAGASLRLVEPVGSEDEVARRTTIVYYDRRSMPAAEHLRSLLGSGTLERRQVFQPEVDVTIVLGKDLPRL